MTFAEQLSVASLAVSTVTGVAAWLALPGFQPAVNRSQRVISALVLTLVAATFTALGIVAFRSRNVPPTDTAARGTTSDTAAIETTAPSETTSMALQTETVVTTPPVTTSSVAKEAPPPPHLEPPAGAGPPRIDEQTIEIATRWKRAVAFSTASNWSEAVPAWKAFIQDYSGHNQNADHAAFYNLGVAYEALHSWSDAAAAFEQATRMDGHKSDSTALLRLGRCYAKLGRWAESTGMYEEVLRIDPNNEVAKRCVLWTLKQQPPTE